NQPGDGVISVGRAGLANVDFRKAKFDRFQLAVANFVACDFRGLQLGERFAPLFTTRPRSVFTSCKFDGADLRQTSPEGTRFEKCSFEDARLDGWSPARAEFVECRFAGEARTEALAMLQGLAQRWQDQREIIVLRVSPAVGASRRVQNRVWDLLERVLD